MLSKLKGLAGHTTAKFWKNGDLTHTQEIIMNLHNMSYSM
jgi:hypothetical protein